MEGVSLATENGTGGSEREDQWGRGPGGRHQKNIRFYEEKGLIAPRRNSENGYREYGPGEVEQLKQIKLLRKLGVPLEEIRRMQSGGHTVGDGMRRHLVTLERERENLERSMELCRTLKDWEQRLDTLEAGWPSGADGGDGAGGHHPLGQAAGGMQGQCGMPPPWPLR